MSENKIQSWLKQLFTGKKKKSIEPETPAEDSARSAESAIQPNAELQEESPEPEKAPSERHIPSGDAADAPQATEGVLLAADPIPTSEEKEDTANPQGSLREGAGFASAKTEGVHPLPDATSTAEDTDNPCRAGACLPPSNDSADEKEETDNPSVAYPGDSSIESEANMTSACRLPFFTREPTKEDEIVATADPVAAASATESLSKQSIAAYLTATYGDDVAVNVRADFNSTGLKLADTHFLLTEMKDGEKVARKKQFCIVYVYHTQPDLTIVLLHLTPDAAQKLCDDGITVAESKFPRTTFGAWYELDVTPDTPNETVYTALDAAVVACGGPIVLRSQPQDDSGDSVPQASIGEGGGPASPVEGVPPVSNDEPSIPANTAPAITLTKQSIAAYLTATYGDGIETATRPDKTKTGLLCADNHYSTIQIKDGERIARKKRLCFVYVYHDEDKNLLRILLKTTPAHAAMLQEKHPAIVPASFPRTTTEPWFDLTIDDTYTVGDVFDAIDGAKKRLDGDLAPLVRTMVESKVAKTKADNAPDESWATELLTKKSVAAYLAATFGEGVTVNSRPDKTTTGLHFADTHYTTTEMIDGELQMRKKPLCFAYVYTSDTGVTVLLRTTAALLAPLMEKHPEIAPSPFPRTKQGTWFSLPANADWQPIELYGAIVDAKIECDGGAPHKNLVRLADEVPADDAAPATEPKKQPVKPSFRVETDAENALEPEQIRESVSYREADKALSDADVAAMTGQAKRKCNPNDRGVINLEVLCRYFEPGESVTLNEIKVRVTGFNQSVTYLKVLTGGNMDRPLCVEADEFSPIAAKMILLAGGKVYTTKK